MTEGREWPAQEKLGEICGIPVYAHSGDESEVVLVSPSMGFETGKAELSLAPPLTKVYIAGPFRNRELYMDLADYLEDNGPYEVTSRWLLEKPPKHFKRFDPCWGEYLKGRMAIDIEDVVGSDLLLLDLVGCEHDPMPRHGSHTELGLALGRGIQVWAIGDWSGFCWAPGVLRLERWAVAFAMLGL